MILEKSNIYLTKKSIDSQLNSCVQKSPVKRAQMCTKKRSNFRLLRNTAENTCLVVDQYILYIVDHVEIYIQEVIHLHSLKKKRHKASLLGYKHSI